MTAKKSVWTVGEIYELLSKGKVPYVDNIDKYKTIRNKLFDDTEKRLYSLDKESE